MEIFLFLVFLLLPTTISGIQLHCEDSSDGQSESLVICIVHNYDSAEPNITGTTIHLDYFYELRFEDSTLSTLPATFFDQIEKLRTIKATESSIENIQGVFVAARHLRKLLLGHNMVKELNAGTFMGARDLGLLDLSYNHITVLGDDTFHTLKYLSYVNLSHNQIESVAADTFKGNEILHYLDLSYNKVQTLDIQVYQLTSVLASHNKIENFRMELLEAEQNRQYYSRFMVKILLDNNEITHFKVDKRFNVRHLGLDHNKINDLGGLDERLPDQIEILDLSYNDLGALTKDTFCSVHNLRSLYLKSSNVKFYDDLVFVELVNLTELDISYNGLEEFDTKLISSLSMIELLRVDGNNLTQFDVEHLPQRVFAISLFDNAWDCGYLEDLFEQLRLHGKVSVPSTSLESMGSEINGVGCTSRATTLSVEEEEHTTEYSPEEE